MKIKLDENLPSVLAPRLAAMRHDVQTVVEEGIAGKPDGVIWQAAQSEARFLITQDMDFSNAQRLVLGTHHGILLIRMRTPSRRALVARVADLFAQEDVTHWAKCFVVATESKVRVRRSVKNRE
jgi:predicted nuclease of predicted toxin-antitoxin system